MILLAFSLSISCSSGPARPTAGTPAFYWDAALERFRSGDYVKASEHLERLTRAGGEFVDRGYPMRLVLMAGLMHGYKDLAEHYEYGSRANKTNPTPFRKRLSDNLSMASRLALQLSQAVAEFDKVQPSSEVVLAFPFPRGSLSLAPQMPKVAAGQLLPDADLASAQTTMLQRGVLQAVCRAVGAEGDSPKTMEILKSPPVKAPRTTFVAGLAESLYDGSTLFSDRKANQPERQEHLLNQTEAILKTAGDTKTDKELRSKVANDRKALAKNKRR
jgi:hypothetical protein